MSEDPMSEDPMPDGPTPDGAGADADLEAVGLAAQQDGPGSAIGLPDLGEGSGEPDGFDMSSLLGMAMDMQQQMLAAQDVAASTLVEGQAGGGVVKIGVTGAMEFQSVTIDPDAVDPDDVEMLQDLVLAALHDAVVQVNNLTRAANPIAGLGLGDLGDLDLGNLGSLSGLGGLPGLAPAGGGGERAEAGFDPFDFDDDVEAGNDEVTG